jgi:16S rRNA A1518/A1519 N6-dimethyltransferase RsmA/KsgA/DIM1 with predicted DNA glycosylase/AP lyase activity
MLSLAQIKPGMKILEPSAGLGHICREVRKLQVEPDCFELSPLLRQGLLLQGFNVIGNDFLNTIPTPIYDRILANPPFSVVLQKQREW